ncbi:MAG: heat shock protein Hsp20 [Solirubrobacterales bacterium]|jgi:HSP20 family protein|nr:heat shock protein Hsp20 [Solirubrobacterales bacterium]
MAILMEPIAPWLRDLNRFLAQEGGINTYVPPADVLVDDDGVTIYMDVPGVNRDNLEIDLDNEVLTVRGERQVPYREEDGSAGPRRIERTFGRFERSIRVPRGLDPESIEASMADGVLRLRIPKPETMKPRKIEIKEGTAAGSPTIEGTAQESRPGEGATEQSEQGAGAPA